MSDLLDSLRGRAKSHSNTAFPDRMTQALHWENAQEDEPPWSREGCTKT